VAAEEHRRRRLVNVIDWSITTAGRRYAAAGCGDPEPISLADVRARAADDGLDVDVDELAALLRARILYRQAPGVVLVHGPGRTDWDRLEGR